MPWKVVPNHPDCPSSEPFGVVNTQTGRKVACHATAAGARRQVAALYVNVPESQEGAAMDRSEKPDFRAEWTTAYINNLPDSSFAYIEGGGTKDDQGKTTPRSKRHFPIKNAEGQCDRAHVRNALSRAPQSPFGPRAMGKIRACASQLGIGQAASFNRGSNGMLNERRYTPLAVEYREEDGRPAIGGYAAVYNKPSKNLGGFIEMVDPRFANRSASRGWSGIVARFNHDDNLLLGSTDARTLTVSSDEEGLSYRVHPPKARADVLELVQRGDVRWSSFAFYAIEDEWGVSDENYPQRNLISGDIVDVSPVVNPAYDQTSAEITLQAASLSLSRHKDVPPDEAREMLLEDRAQSLFMRTDRPQRVPEKVPTLGAQAVMDIMAKEDDPLA